jgi:hypothetical protein
MIRLWAIDIMVLLAAAKGYAYGRKRSACVILDFPK